MKHIVRLIALDMDGTLLNSRKELSPVTRQALFREAEKGTLIIPATGRLCCGLPKVIRELPFVRYVISINGASVLDLKEQKSLYRAELPNAQAIEILRFLDTLPVFYDCYQSDAAWMTRSVWERAEEYAPDVHYLKMIRQLRTPVDDLKCYLSGNQKDVQKLQLYTWDKELLQKLPDMLYERFSDILVSKSVKNNLEINQIHANKGEALQGLAQRLGIDMEQVMAFGDEQNDLSMLRLAGCGVCMGNGSPEAKAAARYVTDSCDEDGVAKAIERYCE